MATTVFDLQAVLGLDSSKYESGLSKAGSMAKSFGSGIATAAKVGLAAVTAATTAVAGFTASAIKEGMSFDTAMSQVAATMGKTMDGLKEETAEVDLAWGKFSGNLREYAQEMGRNTRYTATEAAEALNYMALAGYDVEKSMKTLPSVMALASAGAMDLAKASDMVTDTETAFGLTSERTAQMVDEMAKAASTGNTSVEQLGTAFLRLGPTAQELNGGMIKLKDGTMQEIDGVQQLETALVAMADAGIKGTRAGTNMLQMIMKLSDPTKDGAAQLEKLGVEVYNDQGQMRALSEIFRDFGDTLGVVTQEERINAFADLFNTRDMAAAKTLMLALTDDYVKFGDEIYAVDEAYQKWGNDIYDSSKGFEFHQKSFDRIGEAISNASEAGVLYQGKLYDMETALKEFGSELIHTSDDFKILGAAEFMQREQNNNLAGDITFLKSAYSGLQLAISDLFTQGSESADKGQGVLRDYVQFATDSINKITDAFKEGGLEAVIPAVSEVLEGAVKILLENLDTFIDAGMQLLGAIGQGLLNNLDLLVETGITIITKFGEAIVNNLPVLIDAGLQIIEALLNAVAENIDQIMEAGHTLLQGIVQAVSEHSEEIMTSALFIIETLFNGLVDNIPKVMGFVTELFVNLVKWIGENADQIIDGAIALIEAISKGLIDNLPKIIDATVELVMTLAEALTDPDNLQKILQSALDIITTLAEGLVKNLPILIPAAVETILSLVEGLLDNIDQVIDAAIEIIIALAEGLIDALPKLLEKAPVIIEKLIGAIVKLLPKIIEMGWTLIVKLVEGIVNNLPAIIKAAIDIVSSLVKGIGDYIGEVIKAAKRIMDTIKETIEDFDVVQWGKDMIDSFIEGIKGRIDSVVEAAKDIGSAIKEVLGFSEPEEGPLSNFHTFAPDMMKLFAEGITDNMDLVNDAIDEVADAVARDIDVSPTMTYDIGTQVSTATPINNALEEKISDILMMLEMYMPTYATAQDMESMSVNVDGRQFGRLVREVG